jgi:putative transposase
MMGMRIVGADYFHRPVKFYNVGLKQRKHFHLLRDNYIGRRIYFVTICSATRAPRFLERGWVERVISVMKEEAATAGFLLHAWCLMPDHLHILVEGAADNADLFRFTTRFKRRTACLCASTGDAPLWQRNFYEHIVRDYEVLGRVAAYIWMNPVRKGLCEVANEYPFSGSLTMPWKAASEDPWMPPWKAKRADEKNRPLQNHRSSGSRASC